MQFRRSYLGLALSAPAWSGPPFIREGKENTAFLFSLSLMYHYEFLLSISLLTVKSQLIVIGPIVRSTASNCDSVSFLSFFISLFLS